MLQVALFWVYVAICSAVGVPVSGHSLTNKSLAGGFDPAMMSPLIASHISRIRVVDWIWSSHNLKFGPLSVGILNLLMSIFVYSLVFGFGCGLWVFYTKWAYTIQK